MTDAVKVVLMGWLGLATGCGPACLDDRCSLKPTAREPNTTVAKPTAAPMRNTLAPDMTQTSIPCTSDDQCVPGTGCNRRTKTCFGFQTDNSSSASGAPTISVRTKSNNGRVYLDGAQQCDAPCSFEVEPGEHVVGLDVDGYAIVEKTVVVRAGTHQIYLQPTKRAEDFNVLADD